MELGVASFKEKNDVRKTNCGTWVEKIRTHFLFPSDNFCIASKLIMVSNLVKTEVTLKTGGPNRGDGFDGGRNEKITCITWLL